MVPTGPAKMDPSPATINIWVLSGRPPSRANKPLRQAFSGHAIGRAQVRDLGEGRSAVALGPEEQVATAGAAVEQRRQEPPDTRTGIGQNTLQKA